MTNNDTAPAFALDIDATFPAINTLTAMIDHAVESGAIPDSLQGFPTNFPTLFQNDPSQYLPYSPTFLAANGLVDIDSIYDDADYESGEYSLSYRMIMECISVELEIMNSYL